MNIGKEIVRVAAIVLLLSGLSIKAYAGEVDSIFRGAAWIVGGGLLLAMAFAGLIVVLNRKTPPASQSEVLLPLMAALLAAPLNVAWLFMASVYVAPYSHGWVLHYLLFGLPTVGIAILLWRAKSRNRAWALGISCLLVALLLAPESNEWRHAATSANTPYANLPTVSVSQLPEVVDSPDATRVLDHADQMPIFPGGSDSLHANLSRRLSYPQLARADQVSGRVRMRYVVGIDGQVPSAEVTQGLGGGAYDNEALRVLQELSFVPAQQNGEIVAVYDTVSVVFKRLKDNE